MSIETIKTMKNVDIRTVDKASLVDIKDVKINPSASREEKAAEYLRQIKNPYCFLCSGYAVKLQFADSGKTFEDCLTEYIDTLI